MGMDDLSGLAGNVLFGPWNQSSMHSGYSSTNSCSSDMQAMYLARQSVVPLPSPEETRQNEIKRKNERNYAAWLARITRDPLTGCEAR